MDVIAVTVFAAIMLTPFVLVGSIIWIGYRVTR